MKESMNFYQLFGTSTLGVSEHNNGFVYDKNNFWSHSQPIKVDLYGENETPILKFIKYKYWYDFICCVTPDLKCVLEQFKLPEHKWYKAQAGYDLEFVSRMKKYFNIDYDIDINEKRDYWILQILDRRIEELQFSKMRFNVVDFRNRKNVLKPFDAKINSMEEYNRFGKEVYLQSKKSAIIEDIDSSVYIYRENYDILWGGTHIVFNEKVKAALEATNIITSENGLEFAEFTDYRIEMLGEQV